ncbi:sigma-54-dependent transcriptional regulator [Blastopirellula marina]|uniref:DNA-binding transcriptional regulator NtrC n=1 Tax=Blastopirellula marina DSM 3645 TaxID=314230 RepID=A3ZXP8_9BACT|nr:sigma-54 dependent transcriptional regulator [Blastopirellula marina]EAQ78605.1 nitrogen regulation protein NR(I) [Blastopirellula marina DSM 3645]
MADVLIVDDEPSVCWAVSSLAEAKGHHAEIAASAEEALQKLNTFQPAAIVLDVRLPGKSGLEAIEAIRSASQNVPIILITAFGDLETAVAAVRSGAFEYIVKPFDAATITGALERALTPRETTIATSPNESILPPDGMVGKSLSIQTVFKKIAQAAAADACVLIEGESGSGKELAARAIHQHSARSAGPFVAVNLASLSPSLVESELFGHTRGAFTDAHDAKPGYLQLANGGTLFLDEVADIPAAAQVKLLRALEHGEVTPVGGGQPVPTRFRVISATHRHLLSQVEEGDFRHDLYFRLSAFRLQLPPLRERVDDIPELAKFFLSQLGAAGQSAAITTAALTELKRRPWYGNVREFRNALEHAQIVSMGDAIRVEHLPAAAPPLNTTGHVDLAELVRSWAQQQLATGESIDDLHARLLALVEPPLLRAALENHQGQFVAAAKTLGMHRTTVKKKADEYGISSD